MTDAQRIKAEVSRHYAEKVKESAGCCGTDCCGAPGPSGHYPVEVLEQIPAGVVTFGSGNPVGMAGLSVGEVVLDLGSGAGLDCFIAGRGVGPSGSVVGVDFTQAMIDRATENAAELGMSNVSFKLGDIEALPQADDSVDVIISNCVINLAPDKAAVFREAFRVLRSGGRLVVSDIVLTRPATAGEAQDMALVTGCIAGSLPAEEYADTIRAAGFEDVSLEGEVEAAGTAKFWYSAAIRATKP
jgi:arsenite methyltransferase